MGRRKKPSLGLKVTLATITWAIVFGLLIYFTPYIVVKYVEAIVGILLLIYNIWALFIIDADQKQNFFDENEPWAI